MVELGRTLREERKRLGLTILEAARGGSVSVSTVKRWESGERVPHGSLLAAYTRFLRSQGSTLDEGFGVTLDLSRSRVPGLLAFYRRRAGLTLRVAGAAVGLSAATLHRIEMGIRYPDDDELERLDRLYRIRPCDLAALCAQRASPLPKSAAEAAGIGYALNDLSHGKEENRLAMAAWVAQVGDSYFGYRAAGDLEALQCLAAWQSATTAGGDWGLAAKVAGRMASIAHAEPRLSAIAKVSRRFQAFYEGTKADAKRTEKIARRLYESARGRRGLDAYDAYLYGGRLVRRLGDFYGWRRFAQGLVESGRESRNTLYAAASRVQTAAGDDQFELGDRVFEVCAEVDRPEMTAWVRFLADVARFEAHCRRSEWEQAATYARRMRMAFETHGFSSPVLEESIERFPPLREALDPELALTCP